MWFPFVALVILVARRPETLTSAEFFQEDGQIFYIGTYFGHPLEFMLQPYQGYLHLVPRIGGLASRLGPVEAAPLITNLYSLILAALLATYVASDRLAILVPSAPARMLMATLLLLLPATHELYGSVTYTQWIAAIYLALRLVARPVNSRPALGRRALWLDRALLLVAGLSSPLVILYALIATLRRIDGWRWFAGAASVQLFLAIVTPRIEAVGSYDLETLFRIVGIRMVVEPLLGANWTARLVDSSGIGIAVVVCGIGYLLAIRVLTRVVQPRHLMLVVLVGMLSAAAGLAAAPDRGTILESPDAAQRYFLLWGVIVAAGVAFAAHHDFSQRGRLAVLPIALLVVGVVGDARMPPRPVHDWARTSQCIGLPDPCDVPVEPVRAWTIRWPGDTQTYLPLPIGRSYAR